MQCKDGQAGQGLFWKLDRVCFMLQNWQLFTARGTFWEAKAACVIFKDMIQLEVILKYVILVQLNFVCSTCAQNLNRKKNKHGDVGKSLS